MAGCGGDVYTKNVSKEINYLKSILNSLKYKAPERNPDWSELVQAQQRILNTLRGDFATKLTDLEQKMKNNTIRIFGIPDEKPVENTRAVARDFFSEQLKLVVYPQDIDCCYRYGKYDSTRCRAILVKFATDDVRKNVLKRKIALWRNDVQEELCSERYKIRQEAISKFGKDNVSVVDGSVQVAVPGEDRRENFFTLMQFRNFPAKNKKWRA